MPDAHQLPSRNSRRNRRRRGQAMMEYSLIFWLMGIVFILGVTWDGTGWSNKKTIDASGNHNLTGQNTTGHDSIFGLMLNSYQIYQDSYYFALCAPIP